MTTPETDIKTRRGTLVISGLSGSGMSRALDCFEDFGYYCVDNVAPQVLPKLIELAQVADFKYHGLVVVFDVRNRDSIEEFMHLAKEYRQGPMPLKILWIEASDRVLIRRFKEVRRNHPLQDRMDISLADAISREKEILKEVRQAADYQIDTSRFTIATLKEQLREVFGESVKSPFAVRLVAFGFKYGLVLDADLVFDSRFLPNPFYDEDLRPLTGEAGEVRRFVMEENGGEEFVERTMEYLEYLLPLYRNEGRMNLVLAVGCTGGRHRSVAIVREMEKRLRERKLKTVVELRDLEKD
jgi:UPF0042 nucleotide-binding protein